MYVCRPMYVCIKRGYFMVTLCSERVCWRAPVVEDDVWSPDACGRNSDTRHSVVLTGVPRQLVVTPFLYAPAYVVTSITSCCSNGSERTHRCCNLPNNCSSRRISAILHNAPADSVPESCAVIHWMIRANDIFRTGLVGVKPQSRDLPDELYFTM